MGGSVARQSAGVLLVVPLLLLLLLSLRSLWRFVCSWDWARSRALLLLARLGLGFVGPCTAAAVFGLCDIDVAFVRVLEGGQTKGQPVSRYCLHSLVSHVCPWHKNNDSLLLHIHINPPCTIERGPCFLPSCFHPASWWCIRSTRRTDDTGPPCLRPPSRTS